MYIYGIHPVIEALRAGKNFERILLRRGLEGSNYKELMNLVGERGVPYAYVPVEKLDRTVRGVDNQGVVGVLSEIVYCDLEEMVNNALARSEDALLVLLDGVSDVRNLGAVARTLECAGGTGLILPARGGAAVNADAVKTSAGALMRLDVCRSDNLKVAALYLKQAGFRLVAATEKCEDSLYDCDLRGPVALVMGSEERGISPAMLGLCDARVRIPMSGEISSLNVSVAAAIVLYEAVRQRRPR